MSSGKFLGIFLCVLVASTAIVIYRQSNLKEEPEQQQQVGSASTIKQQNQLVYDSTFIKDKQKASVIIHNDSQTPYEFVIFQWCFYDKDDVRLGFKSFTVAQLMPGEKRKREETLVDVDHIDVCLFYAQEYQKPKEKN